MSLITYGTKDKTATDNVANRWTAENSNEIKSVVNTKTDAIQFMSAGVNLGTSGTVTQIDFTGSNINAVLVGTKLTITFS